ncbi:hypothetical protein CF54_19735 [Streptomyces sp. Tu 6176]|uniref:hypothetical protein n=1 Tax=Streptomyces sp. Tu 6176 TaxID=1470557 RepID=UPI00044DCFD1|nr:hypothetical protein [Streptomyces sp. Tu 6176]EYT81405.1 hypothetical protein CF54_19735 [Streptomyces sp. Tu 6176]
MTTVLRLAALPARSLVAVLGALLIAPVVLASLPALLVTSFTPDGPNRWQILIEQITAWTRTALSSGPADAPAPARRRRGPAPAVRPPVTRCGPPRRPYVLGRGIR